MSDFSPEDALLKVLMAEPATYWQVSQVVTADDFSDRAARLYRAIGQSIEAGEKADAVTLADKLGDGLGNEAMDIAFNAVGSPANVESYARMVAERGEARRVRQAGQRIALVGTYGEAQDILAEVRPQQAAQVKSVKDGLAEMIDSLQARYDAGGMVTGVPTGVESLDALTGGWQPGNLIVLVGETSMGKSALALQSALAAAKHAKECGKSVLYFSLEMTAGELTERAVANLGDFPLRWITQPSTAPEHGMSFVQRGSEALRHLPLMIDDRCGLSQEQIVSRATQLHMQNPLALVVVDYMHIMARPRRNDVAELGQIATTLKNLSKSLNVPVIALHQLNRGNLGSRPSLGDIRASGEIAETANTVIAIYRSEIAKPEQMALRGYAEALILKQRQGRRDVRAWMSSRLANMRLDSCEPPDGYDETITSDKGQESTTVTALRPRKRAEQF